jgi:hypothetical protein
MQKTNSVALKSLICSVLLFLVVANHSGGHVFADSAPPASSSTSSTGPNKPTGAAASTYTYDSATGLWENQYYSWNPVTQQTEPLTPQTYSYNPATGMWDTTDWVFDASQGKYVPNTNSVTTPPAGAPTTGGPTTTPDSSSSTSTSPDGSTSNTSTTNPSSGNFDLFYNANISGNVNSNATSGNASVSGNTTAGDATSGNAEDLANLINLLQSSGSLSNADLQTFEDNITGNVNGDLLIDPATLLQALGTQLSNNLTNVQLQSLADGEINNNVTLNADSGDTSVNDNTAGGSATSGSADAVANLINLIDSNISAGQSFLGVVNIFGNLTGNILVPQQFLDSLIGSNSPSTSTGSPTLQTDTGATVNNNESVNNNVNAGATTGNASVTGNTTAGNATTGTANTNVTLLNLTGNQVIGNNALLVFVNVLGTWVGMIMNAPGSTAAALGGGLTTDSVLPTATTANANINTNEGINNNVNLDADSGNATVANNTSAGDATSGNSTSSANIVNILGSQFNLSNWFGILFINVFGTWTGNFGVAQPPAADASTTQDSGASTGTSTNTNVKTYRVMLSELTTPGASTTTGGGTTINTINTGSNGEVLGLTSAHIKPGTQTTFKPANVASVSTRSDTFGKLLALAGVVSGAGLLATERIMSARQKRAEEVETPEVK